MPFITITIDGIDEIISGLNNIISGLDSTKHSALQEGSDFMANQMRNNAHVISGRMKASISNSVSADTATIDVSAPYALYENRRVGGPKAPHDFADRALSTTEQQFPNIVGKIYSNLFR